MGSFITRRSLLKRSVQLGVAASAANVLAPFGALSAFADDSATDLGAIEAAAKQEGTVNLYTFVQNVDLTALYQQSYPWAKLNNFAFPTSGQIKAKFLPASRAGANVADVIIGFGTD